MKSTKAPPKRAGNSPSTRHGLRTQTTDKKNPHWESRRAWPIATLIRHTHTRTPHTNYIGGVSDLSLAQTQTPLPPDSISPRPDSTSASLARTQKPPTSPHLLPAFEITIRNHRSPPSAAHQRRRPCLGRQRYPYPSPAYLITYLPFKDLSRPVPSHHTTPHRIRNAPHRPRTPAHRMVPLPRPSARTGPS